MTINWSCKPFNELTTAELYAILELRALVFVVEQQCVYQDVDGKDQVSYHLMGWDNGQLAAYTRIIPPGISYTETSIGRVVTSPGHRGTGIGRELMKISIDKAFNIFHNNSIRIGAQVYLLGFYRSLGFIPAGTEYLEDGIPHIEMVLEK